MEREVAVREWALEKSLHYLSLIIEAQGKEVLSLSKKVDIEAVLEDAEKILDFVESGWDTQVSLPATEHLKPDKK